MVVAQSPGPSVDRRAVLEREVVSYVKRGYRVVSQTDSTAQLVRPKKFSFAIFLILLLTGIGPIIYIAWYFAKRDRAVFITVDERGRVSRR